MPQGRPHLIGRDRQRHQTITALGPVYPSGLTRDQICVKNRLDAVLQPCHLGNQLSSFSNQASLQLYIFSRHPDLGQETRSVQASKSSRIDFVCLDLGPGDCSNLQRVCNHDPVHEGLQQPNNGCSVSSCLQDDVVILVERLLGEGEYGIALHEEATMILDHAVLEDCNLGKSTMNIKSDYLHGTPPSVRTRRKLAGNTTTTDSRSQRNRASRRGGQLTTRARSSLSSFGLPAMTCFRRPYPGANTIYLDGKPCAPEGAHE